MVGVRFWLEILGEKRQTYRKSQVSTSTESCVPVLKDVFGLEDIEY